MKGGGEWQNNEENTELNETTKSEPNLKMSNATVPEATKGGKKRTEEGMRRLGKHRRCRKR